MVDKNDFELLYSQARLDGYSWGIVQPGPMFVAKHLDVFDDNSPAQKAGS